MSRNVSLCSEAESLSAYLHKNGQQRRQIEAQNCSDFCFSLVLASHQASDVNLDFESLSLWSLNEPVNRHDYADWRL